MVHVVACGDLWCRVVKSHTENNQLPVFCTDCTYQRSPLLLHKSNADIVMDSAKDISKKIRSAIKAKLVELGAYVDDELPDYIMVMVANKKTESQMTEDLSLFLGHNTDKFTSWLHGLLVKLQSLSSDQQKIKEKPSQADPNQNKEEDGPTEKKSPSDKQQPKSNKSPAENNGKSKETKRTATKRKSSDLKEKVGNKESEKKEISKDKNESIKTIVTTKVKDEEYVSELLEKVEVDEFSEEFNKEQEQQKVPKMIKPVAPTIGEVKKSKTPGQLTQTVMPQVSETAPKLIPTRDLSYPPKKKVVSKKVKNISAARKTDNTLSKSEATHSAKKKKPASVVGTIKQKYTELPPDDDDDEEYDPMNPSFGKVASAVKVSRRRLPISQQANKNLIMKATAEAEKSVTSTLHNVLKEEKLYSAREKATVKPMQRKSDLRQPRIRPNIELISKSRREEMMRKLTYTVSNEESPESDEPEEMKIVIENKVKSPKMLQHTTPEKLTYKVTNSSQIIKQEGRSEDIFYAIDTKPHQMQYVTSPETVQYAISKMPQTVQVVSNVPAEFVTRSQPQTIQYITRLPSGQVAYTERNEPQFVHYVKVEPQPVEMETVTPTFSSDTRRFQHVARVQPVMDSRLVKRKSVEEVEGEVMEVEEEDEDMEMLPDIVNSDDGSCEEQMLSESPESVIHMEEVQKQEDDDNLSLGEEEKTPEPSPEPEQQVEPVRQKRVIKERLLQQTKPKRVHINPKFIVTLDGVDPKTFTTDDTYTEEDVKTPKQPVTVISKITPPAITPITFNLKDTDDEEEESEESPPKKSKPAEKCKFWPACHNGNSCSFHHPTVPCKMFPSCKFGDKCLYIHPNCKFDAKCSKKDCPFTHASKRGNIVIKQYIPMPVPPVPSYRPKPPTTVMCRFADKCHNIYCQFQHPANCRYGANCSNKVSCQFAHPQILSKDKYSWTATKTANNCSTKKLESRKSKTVSSVTASSKRS